MTGSETRKGRGGDARPRWLTLRVLFGILTVAPVALLFASISGSTGDDIAADTRERQGIEYLTGLGPLATVLTAAQSDAVAGRVPSADALSQASSAVDNVDARLGETLGAHSLWLDVRTRLGAIATTPPRGEAAFARYTEVADLLLALFDKVRTSAGLVRDPAIDANLLQHAAAEDLPGAIVAVGRFADLAALAPGRADQALAIGQVIAARDSALRFGDHLVRDLHAAVGNTSSPTLSARLFTPLDEFRLAMDGIAKSAAFGDSVVSQQDIAAIRKSRGDVTDAVGALYGAVLGQLDAIAAGRLDSAEAQRELALGAVGLGILLGLLPAAAALRSRRRGRPPRRPQPMPDTADLSASPPSWGNSVGSAMPSRETSGAPT